MGYSPGSTIPSSVTADISWKTVTFDVKYKRPAIGCQSTKRPRGALEQPPAESRPQPKCLLFILPYKPLCKHRHLLCIDAAGPSVPHRCSARLSGYNYWLFVCASMGADTRCKRSLLLQESLQRSSTVVCLSVISLGIGVNSSEGLLTVALVAFGRDKR